MYAAHNYVGIGVEKNSVIKKKEQWKNTLKSTESTGSKV